MPVPRCTAICVQVCHPTEVARHSSAFSLVGLAASVCLVVPGQYQLGLSAEDPTVTDTIWPSQRLPTGPRLQGAAGAV